MKDLTPDLASKTVCLSKAVCSSKSKAMTASTPSPTKTWNAKTRRKHRLCIFFRFEFPAAAAAWAPVRAGVKLGCDRRNYLAHVDIAVQTLACLAANLR
jgi:hypothetical protein